MSLLDEFERGKALRVASREALEQQHRINVESIPRALDAVRRERDDARKTLAGARELALGQFVEQAHARVRRMDTIYHCLRRFQREFGERDPLAPMPVEEVGERIIASVHRQSHKILDDVGRLLGRGHVAEDVFRGYLSIRAKYLTGETRPEESPMAYTPKKTVVVKKRHEFEVEREHGAPINIRMMSDAIRVATKALEDIKGERASQYDDSLFFEPRDESIVIWFEVDAEEDLP